MKIASVCNYPNKTNVGGGQVPAVAFKKWCDIYLVDCDVVSIADTNNGINTMIPDLKVVKSEYELNEYDFIFFSSIGSIDYEKIKQRFAVMLHAEFDKTFYGEERSELAIKKSDFVVVIGNDYWKTKKREFFWYPCTLPEYLLRISDDFEKVNDWGDISLLYSARLSTWKNAALLAAFTHLSDYKHSIGKTVVYGEANNKYYGDAILRMNPNWEKKHGIYNIYDNDETKERHKGFHLFWDVNGSDTYRVQLKRMNLSAFEALKFGLLPVVDSNAVPDVIKYNSIWYDRINRLHSAYSTNTFNTYRQESIYNIARSEFGYQGVSEQITRILYAIGV